MTKRRESREQAFTLLFEKTVTGDSMEDIIEMADINKKARRKIGRQFEQKSGTFGFHRCRLMCSFQAPDIHADMFWNSIPR